MLLTSSKSVPKLSQISDEEKLNLFEQARGYRGGAAPSQEMLQEFQQRATQSQLKIDELKLRSEFEAYLKSKENEPLSQ